jgi:hypothetical protein
MQSSFSPSLFCKKYFKLLSTVTRAKMYLKSIFKIFNWEQFDNFES